MKHQDIISRMTLAEKCAILSGRDEWHTRENERLGIPPMTMSDGPSGLRKQNAAGDHLGLNESAKATCIPSAAALANSWSQDAAREAGSIVGSDAASQGVDVLLGPGLNVKRSPLCGRNFEYYSEDPYLAGKMAAGYISGVQGEGVAACAKHFACNSQELRRMCSDSEMDERTLREIYLTNFEIAIKEGHPASVMSSYNMVNGTYANENQHLYDILRGEWKFDGAVITDWGGSNDFTEGVRAGMNLEMPSAGDDSPCQLIKAVQEGKIAESIVDERVDQLLDVILREKKQPASCSAEERHRHAEKLAEKCIVLLKNQENILPLQSSCKVAVTGDFAAAPRYQGAGSSMVNAAQVDDTVSLIGNFFPQWKGYTKGFSRVGDEDEALAQQSLDAAKDADCVIVYIGLPEGYETEGCDRDHIRLPENQVQLLRRIHEVNPHIVAVLSCGSCVDTDWAQYCQAILYGCLTGEASAEAMLNVISGKVNPSGKLAETFPVKYEDIPGSRYYPGLGYTSEYREAIYVGYRYFATTGKPVAFPFGFGMSYTTFTYSNLEIAKDGVTFNITNTGSMAGEEIAQMYVSLSESKVFRPAIELKGFAKVSLEKGETKKVTISFDDYTFRYFNVKKDGFSTETGNYVIKIGASSQNILLSGSVHIEGDDAPNPYESDAFDCYRRCDIENVNDESFSALLGREIPKKDWDRAGLLCMNDSLGQMEYAKNPVARLISRKMKKAVEEGKRRCKPDLNTLCMYNMPFRGIAKMTHGMVTVKMAEDVLFIANGHFFRGMGRLIRDFIRKPKLPE